MNDLRLNRFPRTASPGQSLVEVALFLPILIFLVAGIVEVGHLLVTQNRVTTAVRTAAGFGAANFDREDWPGTAAAMGDVTLNTVTETLNLSSHRWDIWSIRAQTNESGDAFALFEAEHVYGVNQVTPADAWTALEGAVQAEMLEELRATGADSAANLEVVASIAYHDIETILGIPLWQWTGLKTVQALTVMRVHEPQPLSVCPLLPISVRLNQYSLYPSNWPEELQLNPERYPADPVERFPLGSGPTAFEYPDSPPMYQNEATAPTLRANQFLSNYPGVYLRDARPGFIYLAREQGPSGSFGWLSWRPPSSSESLRESLAFPGNYDSASVGYPGSPADTGATGDPPGASSGDGDGMLELHEWVENSTGNISAAEGIIRDYIDREMPVTIIITDQTNGLTGENANYRVAGFLVARILGYSFQGSNADKWILFEFVDWHRPCSE
ncbi:MAG: TadE family protein [Candidatus Promineifilaceae bacterium]|nr:TadE family protein [Candidatus Promineifilaceae bacterium]